MTQIEMNYPRVRSSDNRTIRKFNPGMAVSKRNGKPFKNGEMVATIDFYDDRHIRSVWIKETGEFISSKSLVPARVAPSILSVKVAAKDILALLTGYVNDLGIAGKVEHMVDADEGLELVLGA